MTGKKILKRIAKTLFYVIGFIIVIIIALFIFINTNYGKRVIRDKVVSYLSHKLKTKVVIGSIDFSLPKWIELNGVYIEDQHKDTLLYGEKIAVDIKMLKLISGGIHIRKVALNNMYANISRPENDSSFNFQFIIDAFTSKEEKVPVVKDTTALDITLNQLLLKKVRINFKDNYGGNSFSAMVTNFDATLNKFQPDRLQFGVDKFNTDSVEFIMTTTKETAAGKTSEEKSKNELLVTANEFNVRNLHVIIDNKVSGMYYANTVQHLLLTGANFDLAKENAAANKLQLDSSLIQFISPKAATVKLVADTTTAATSNWKIALNELRMQNNRFQMDNNASPAKDGLDFSHLAMEKNKYQCNKNIVFKR